MALKSRFDVSPVDDHALLRFLRARRWDVDVAHRMLLDHIVAESEALLISRTGSESFSLNSLSILCPPR